MNCYKIITLLLVSALIISPAAGTVGAAAEEESTWWDTTKDYADYAWETVKEHPYQVMIGITALLATGAGLYWYGKAPAAPETMQFCPEGPVLLVSEAKKIADDFANGIITSKEMYKLLYGWD